MSISVLYFDDPCSPDKTLREVPYGQTYADLLEQRETAIIIEDGRRIPKSEWGLKPKEGTFVIVRIVPADPFSIAVSIFAGLIIGAGVVDFIGQEIEKEQNTPEAILKRENKSFSKRPGLRGAGNALNPYGSVPLVLGTHYIAPSYIGRPYTELSGTDGVDQYLHLSFLVGYGTLRVETFRIGDNLLASNNAHAATGTIAVDGLFASGDVEIDMQQMSPTAMAHYPSRIVEDQFNIKLRNPSGSPTYLYRGTPYGTTKIEVDLEFSAGLITGENAAATVQPSVYYCPGIAWDEDAKVLITDTAITKTLNKTLRYSFSATPATPGVFLVRCGRLTEDTEDDVGNTVRDTLFWTALRSTVGGDPISARLAAKTVRVSMRLKASDNLNAIGTISMIASSIVPVWDDADWATSAVSSNPSALALHVMRTAGILSTPVPDANIDWPAFTALYTWCETNSNYCNALVDTQLPLRDLLAKILSTARASIVMKGAVFSLAHDIVKATPYALITPRNSWDFVGSRSFYELPHGYRVTFINAAAGYQEDTRLVLADRYLYGTPTVDFLGTTRVVGAAFGTTGKTYAIATRIEQINRWGLTDPDEVFKEARYMLAVKYRRQDTYTIKQDFESIGYTRGDLVRFGHDVPLSGIVGGRVKSLTGTTTVVSITADEEFTMETGKLYAIRYQRADTGVVYLERINTVVGTSPVLALTLPPLLATGPAIGDLFYFGIYQEETEECIVVGIEPADELSATVSLRLAAADCIEKVGDATTAHYYTMGAP